MDILVIEAFIRTGCPECIACEDALNKHLIKEDQYKKAYEDPSTNENDRQSSHSKRRGK